MGQSREIFSHGDVTILSDVECSDCIEELDATLPMRSWEETTGEDEHDVFSQCTLEEILLNVALGHTLVGSQSTLRLLSHDILQHGIKPAVEHAHQRALMARGYRTPQNYQESETEHLRPPPVIRKSKRADSSIIVVKATRLATSKFTEFPPAPFQWVQELLLGQDTVNSVFNMQHWFIWHLQLEHQHTRK